MAFDPTKPVDHSEITAKELRDQFTALRAESARSIGNLAPVIDEFPTPPTTEDIQAIASKVNQLIDYLRNGAPGT